MRGCSPSSSCCGRGRAGSTISWRRDASFSPTRLSTTRRRSRNIYAPTGWRSIWRAVEATLAGIADFEPVRLKRRCAALADARGVKAATLIHGIRVAITGKAVSPGLFEVVALVGRERARARLLAAVQLISSHRPA